MKKVFTICLSLLFSVTMEVFTQTGTFDFTSASTLSNATIITQTVNTVALTLTGNNGGNNSFVADGNAGTYGIGMNGTAASMNGAYASTVTFTFDKTINIGTMRVADFEGPNSWNLHFLASNSQTHDITIDGLNGTTVNFGTKFVGITSITLTRNGGGTFCLYIDNIYMDGTLPVELTSFTGAAYGNIVALDWATATEINNYGFEIERSVILSGAKKLNADGGTSATLSASWETLGFVQGHGNSNSPKNYSFEDKNPPVGKVQYRLKQIDFNGAFEYSPIVEVNVETPSQLMLAQNYPNPFNPETTINYQIPSASHVTLKVFDLLGNEVATLVDEFQQAGTYNQKFNVSHSERSRGMASGVYFYKLQTDNRFSKTKKLMIIK